MRAVCRSIAAHTICRPRGSQTRHPVDSQALAAGSPGHEKGPRRVLILRSPDWTRTSNLPVNSRLLCQLSYRGPAPPTGLEPVTCRLTAGCSAN
ncbi:hypothetical protein SCOCK_20026 [Actinacidiphila cocklensis]|uniref:Uncharacterized protein n=1 Tax=Actinacidiphila cocklensis TaxID=887465 RepID=A0A9W4DN36_9ACTN|nr:hypothetical protein SCOCK_20026 [Actinacidiphila cocklensis]